MTDEGEWSGSAGALDGNDDLDAAALTIALSGASREKADRFLEEHIRTMRREDRIRHRQLRIRHIGDLLKLSGEIFLALLVFLVAAAIGTAMWNAAHDRGLVVEAFSVPPDMMQRGMTGQVVAARLLDKLIAMQNQTQSARAASSYSNNWGNDIKVQIPDTGISLSELYRYMRAWLGAETHITGDVFRQGNAIAVTARTSASPGETFSGADKDFDALLQKAAEAVYANTQPYRYGRFLDSHNRIAEANKVFRKLSEQGSTSERAWGYIGLGTIMEERGDPAGALTLSESALALQPGFFMAISNAYAWEGELDHDEAKYQALREKNGAIRQLRDPDVAALNETETRAELDQEEVNLDGLKGDFNNQLDKLRDMQPLFLQQGIHGDFPEAFGEIDTALHNGRTAALLLPVPRTPIAARALDDAINLGLSTGQHFEGLLPEAKMAAQMKPGKNSDGVTIVRDLWSDAANALALSGDIADAQKLIARTPLDCDICVRTRGRIATMAHDWRAADRWFAMVSARSPSIPFADTDWGWSLLRRGQPAAAIEKLQSAHNKGPHFADPLEYWGEALLYVGKTDDAKKQFAIATGLSLFPDERAQLARDKARALSGPNGRPHPSTGSATVLRVKRFFMI